MAAASNTIYSLVRSPGIECNFLLCCARNQEELDMKCEGVGGTFVKDRQLVLARYLQEAARSLAIDKNADETAFRIRRSTIDLLREKLDANAVLYQIYGGTTDVDTGIGFFDLAGRHRGQPCHMFLRRWSIGSRCLFAPADEIVRS
jgi:hypothetical protein